MNPSKTLMASLRKLNLVSADNDQIDGYTQLEENIISHLAQLNEMPECVVWFDGECIESSENYTDILQKFILAAGREAELQDANCQVDFNSKTASCRVLRSGELIESFWQQESDWVTAEFLEYTFQLINSDTGKFVYIATGDQTYVAVFLVASVLKKLKQFQNKDQNSREAFFMRMHEGVRWRFTEIEILPLNLYNSIKSKFAARYTNGGSISELRAYKDGLAIEIAYVSRHDDALDAFSLIKDLGLETNFYAVLDEWGYGELCPDEACYFLGCEQPGEGLVFSHPARSLGDELGNLDEGIGEYLIVGNKLDWALFIKSKSLICIGDIPLTLARPLIKSIEGNENSKFFDSIIENIYRPALLEHGFQTPEEYSSRVLARERNGTYLNYVLKGAQTEGGAPLEIQISLLLFLSATAKLLGEDGLPDKHLFNFVEVYPRDSGINSWLIKNQQDYEEAATKIVKFIEQSVKWATGSIDDKELFDIYLQDERPMQAAAIAKKMGDLERAKQLVTEQLAQSGPPVFKRRNQKMAEALGFDVPNN